MSKKRNPPCIRDLTRFRKTGCPCKTWDGEDGCPAWMMVMVTPVNRPLEQKDKVGKCIDLWQHDFSLRSLGLLEGNQQAIETFRNNMSVEGSPRPDPAVIKLLMTVKKRQGEIDHAGGNGEIEWQK